MGVVSPRIPPFDDDIHRYEAATTVRSLVLISKAVVVMVVTLRRR